MPLAVLSTADIDKLIVFMYCCNNNKGNTKLN